MEGVVVVGGGWAGCAAALAASKTGLAVTCSRGRTACSPRGWWGIMRNNGRFTAAEELKLMGAGELIKVADAAACHRNLDFPGHRHASLYDVERVELPVERLLQRHGVKAAASAPRRRRHHWRQRDRGGKVARGGETIGRLLYRCQRDGGPPGQLQTLRQWLCHVYLPLPHLRPPGKHLCQGRCA